MKNWLWENPSLHQLAWTLLHLLWQGALIAGGLALALSLLRKRSSQARYLASCVALSLIALAPVLTYRALGANSDVAAYHALADAASLSPASSSGLRLLIPYLPLLTLLWGAGVAALSLRMLAGWAGVYRLGRVKTSAVPASLQRRAAELAAAMGISRTVEVLASGMAEAPMTFGVARRVILLPVSALTGLSHSMLEAILAHELAHIRRHDYLVNLVQTAIETLFFYHPAVWWVSRQIRAERENACDDMAISLLGNPLAYARALASMEELRPAPRMALAANQGDLLSRIQRMLGAPPAKQAASPLHALAGIGVVAIVFMALAAANPARAKRATPTLETADSPSRVAPLPRKAATPAPRRVQAVAAPRIAHRTMHKTVALEKPAAKTAPNPLSNAFQQALKAEMEKPEPPEADDKDIPEWVKPVIQKAKTDVFKALKNGSLGNTLGKTAIKAVHEGLKMAQEEMKKASKEQKQASVEQAKALQEAEREVRDALVKIDD